LGSILGESPAQQKQRIEAATKGANDLTGLVKHKNQPKTAAPSSASAKRKLEDEGELDGGKEKKARVEDEGA